MNVSAERAKPLLNSRGREELRVVAERVRGEIEAELAQERCRSHLKPYTVHPKLQPKTTKPRTQTEAELAQERCRSPHLKP